MDAKTFYDEFLRPFGVPARYAIAELEAFRSAAFAAGHEAGIAEAIKACESKADYLIALNDEFVNKAVRRAVDAIRSLPGKEG